MNLFFVTLLFTTATAFTLSNLEFAANEAAIIRRKRLDHLKTQFEMKQKRSMKKFRTRRFLQFHRKL